MALDTNIAQYDAPEKDLYEIGEIPPMGYVPKQMYAWTIRKERHGNPNTAMLEEVVDVPTLDSHEVLVLVMAAGVNYNGVWAALGKPISPFDGHKQPFHIAGSDASGIVWAVGDKVKRWKVGDEVVIHCNQDDGDDEECNGGDPMYSPSQRIWGYETPDGSFAQFTNVQAQQLMPRPKHLTWEEAACYTLTLATAYRMLFGHEPHDLKPGQNVLVWGASGGLGSYAIQLINTAGGCRRGGRECNVHAKFILHTYGTELKKRIGMVLDDVENGRLPRLLSSDATLAAHRELDMAYLAWMLEDVANTLDCSTRGLCAHVGRPLLTILRALLASAVFICCLRRSMRSRYKRNNSGHAVQMASAKNTWASSAVTTMEADLEGEGCPLLRA